MKKYVLLTIIIFSILFSLLNTSIVFGQGSSADNAEEISIDQEYTCISIDSGDHWFKFYVSQPDTSIKVSINPESDLDVDLYVYDSDQNIIGSSVHGRGIVDSVEFTADTGWYYIKVHYYSGSGRYNLLVSTNGATASEPSNCDNGGGGSGSDDCPCDTPFPCHCSIPGLDWDPCYALAQVYCTITGFVDAVNNAINGFVAAIRSIGQAIVDTFNAIITGIQNGINAFISILQSIAQGITDFLNTIWNGIASFFTTIGNAITSFFTTMWNGITGVFTSIVNAITNGFNAIVNGIQNFASAIANGIAMLIGGLGGPFSGIADWIRENGLLTLGIVLIFIGLVIRPVLYVGILLTIAGLFTSPIGLNPGYVILGAGVILIIVAIARR